MNINDATIYVFTRNDLPLGQDDIQTDHACFHLGMVAAAQLGVVPGIPFLIAKEKLRTKSLLKIAEHCKTIAAPYYLMYDDDVDKENPTALTVLVVDQHEKSFFRKYPLRNYSPVAQAHLGNQGGGANADVAQLREHSVSNRGVTGENPVVSSNL